VPLATWRYKGEPEAGPAHLGFLIDDLVQGGVTHPAVRPDGGHVDLYGYTSLTLAAVQEQAVGLAALQAELRALQAANAQLKAENNALQDRLSKIEAALGAAPGAR
jgi:ketopantoate reductase